MAVDKYQASRRQAAKSELSDHFGGDIVRRGFKNRLKRQFGYRRNVGEPPVLIMEGGEAKFRETHDPGFPQREHPGRLFGTLFEALEFLELRLGFLCFFVSSLNHT